ncbi:kinase-like domain-containing protein [Crassisporium funariophilum]|nr:kinase-like domain-containing protein [Crassisporium funariophilum]
MFPDSPRLRAYEAVIRIARKHWNGATTLYVARLPFGIYITRVYKAVEEVAAARYVKENTSNPVPHIFDCVFAGDPEWPKVGLIVMHAAPGQHFGKQPETLTELSEEKQDIFVKTLRGWFEQPRSLPPPDERIVSSFLGGGLFSYRIDDEELSRALDIRSRTQYKICLTHGDLTPTNILVDKNFRPVALIDWETASWMPEYWGFTRAVYIRDRYVGWREVFKRIFPGYETELMVERAIWDHWVPYYHP